MMRTLLWIDDVRNPIDYESTHNVIWVKSYAEFVSWLDSNELPDIISFDHDLGYGKSGYDCAKYLVSKCQDLNIPVPEYYVHSSNPVGRQNIISLFESYNKSLK